MEHNKVVGVWDFDSVDSRIGSLYIFIHELEYYHRDIRTIAVKNYRPAYEPMLNILKRFSSHNIAIDSERVESGLIHDLIEPERTSRRGSTRWIADLLGEFGGRYPHSNKRLLLKDKPEKIIISVHLKNNQTDPQSNANQQNWHSFFSRWCETSPEVNFILVGDDSIEHRILSLSNVHAFEGQLADYFSVVCESDCFIGMSSAFCAAAILGGKPYRIWKHVGHHTREMALELDQQKQFPFRCKNQKLLTATDTLESVNQECREMLQEMGL
ncbi:hypothetical protein [Aliiglaciecola sp. LCG003]|uniref:hypothetical protein n=1 Tax=Aliiglaciecola sp. LCG003 TaxID=3053655 RepID=UPI0025747A45|nr:hypothetical protein [Aliiglaciecola sp. LCG003]WJG10596.1 hypothetical protein QR722_06025 [Aliiglaciecola sp. LCG003]